MRISILFLALAAVAAEAPKPKPLTKEQAQTLTIYELQISRNEILIQRLVTEINQWKQEKQKFADELCTAAGAKECTIANGLITPKPVV